MTLENNIACSTGSIIPLDERSGEVTKRAFSATKWNIYYCTVIVLLILNGLNNPFVNIAALLMLLSGAVFFSTDLDFTFFPIIWVFLMYSNLEFVIPGGLIIENATFQNLIALSITAKNLILNIGKAGNHTQKRLSITLLYALIFYLSAITFITTYSITVSLATLSLLFFAKRVNDCTDKGSDNTIIYINSLLYCIVGEILYGIIFNSDTMQIGWRAYQFNGVKDPNNVALHCSYAFAYILLYPEYLSAVKQELVFWIGLFTVFFTISLSGLFLYSLLSVCYFIKKRKMKRLLTTLLLLVALWGAVNVIQTDYSSSSLYFHMDAFFSRMDLLKGYDSDRDYDRLTTGRKSLWEEYLSFYDSESVLEKLFGNVSNMSLFKTLFGLRSHNVYIDFLLFYGLFGFFLLISYIIVLYADFFKNKSFDRLFISLLFVVVLFSRSVTPSLILILIYL